MKKVYVWGVAIMALLVLVGFSPVTAQVPTVPLVMDDLPVTTTPLLVPVVNVPIQSGSARVNLMTAMPKALNQLEAGQIPVNLGIPYPSRVELSLNGRFTPGSILASTFPMWRTFEITPELVRMYPGYTVLQKQKGNTLGAIFSSVSGQYVLSNTVAEAVFQDIDGSYRSVQPTGFFLEGFVGGRKTKITSLARLGNSKVIAEKVNLYLQFGTLPLLVDPMMDEQERGWRDSNERLIAARSWETLFRRSVVIIRVTLMDSQGNPQVTSTLLRLVNEPEQ